MNNKAITIGVVVTLILSVLFFLTSFADTDDSKVDLEVKDEPTTSDLSYINLNNTQSTDKKLDNRQGPEAHVEPIGDKVFDIDMANFSFSKTRLEANRGDKITINFTNSGGVHNFVIDEFDVESQTISAGETTTVTFTVTDGGDFEFYCGIGNHKAQGMSGTIAVF